MIIKMAGFYTVPFQKIAPKTAESSKESKYPTGQFYGCCQMFTINDFQFHEETTGIM